MNNAAHLMNTTPTKTLRMPACAGHWFPANLPRRLALPLFLLCAVLLARPCAATPFTWTFTGSLNTARYHLAGTLLQDGMVLVSGGNDFDGNKFTSAELYDPSSGTWGNTGSMNVERSYHTVTLLANGKALVTGGLSNAGVEARCELYDPATGTWSFTGNMNVAREFHSAVLLADGRVLVAGGGLKATEIYDPSTGTWSPTGNTIDKHVNDFVPVPLTVLSDGRVLIEGGKAEHNQTTAIAELYDPATGQWSVTGSLGNPRANHSATLLASGMVLVTGGYNEDFGTLTFSELYDPATGTWSSTGNLMTTHEDHQATLLSNGMVLIAGGFFDFEFTTDVELYDPASGSWSVTGSLNTQRSGFVMSRLANGMVLVAAGYGGTNPVLDTAELYDPGTMTEATMASGRGSIAGQGDTATFNFRANLTGDRPSGSLTFSDAAAGIAINRAKVRTLTFTDNSADLGGNARLGDGTRVTYSVSVTDNSSDGSTDTFTISLNNGYSAGGTLTSGDIQVQYNSPERQRKKNSNEQHSALNEHLSS
jgi:hypothetical protein